MDYGPCGGVESDGRCEVAEHPCVFIDIPTVRWQPTGPAVAGLPPHTPGAAAMRSLMATRPIVVVDFPARAVDAGSIAEVGAVLAGHVDAVLAGDAPHARVQFPPAYRASLIQATGVAVWAGVTCRDRNRVAMEGEFAALGHVGVAGVHCVTGDHPLTGSRPEAAPVFDLDSTRAAALARTFGHLVSVAESPASPPVDRRAARVVEKTRAGAEVCFVNHAGGAAPVAAFIDSAVVAAICDGREVQLPAFVACVPLVVDVTSAEALRSFTSLKLPAGFLDRILIAPDPYEEGITAAIELSADLLSIDGVAGVNLSGGAGPGHELRFARALATVADELGLRRTHHERFPERGRPPSDQPAR